MKRVPMLPFVLGLAVLGVSILAGSALAILAPDPSRAVRSPATSGPQEPDVLWAQYRAACFFIHGIEGGSGALYRIDLADGFGTRRTARLIAEPPGAWELASPDALAYDRRADRLYFADTGDDGVSVLHFYDLHEDAFVVAGPLLGHATGAAFADGGYHYVDRGTDELRRVFLADDGSVFAEASVADFDLDAGMIVEDLAELDGVLYGSTSGGEDTSARFFTYDLDRDLFRTLSTGSATYLQLAFANDRGLITLYGVSTHDGVFYEIDHAEWAEGSTFSLDVAASIPFSDLARGPACG